MTIRSIMKEELLKTYQGLFILDNQLKVMYDQFGMFSLMHVPELI